MEKREWTRNRLDLYHHFMSNGVRMHDRAARRLAETALQAVRDIEGSVKQGHAADFALKRFLHHHRELGGRDRRFISNLVFSYFRWFGWIAPMREGDLPAACLQAWLLDANAPHSGANALAALAEMAPENFEPKGQATLEQKLAAFKEWRKDKEHVSLRDLLPGWILDALYIPPDKEKGPHTEAFIEACQVRPPTWLRLAHGYEEVCLAEFAQRGIEMKRHTVLPNAVGIATPFALSSIHAARHGELEIQDLASQCVGLLCAPQPGGSWWDVCAGSGGKSLHLADLTGDRGLIRGTDIRPGILKEFARRVRKTRFTCIKTADIGPPDASEENVYDGVLLDAPCSGLGTWSRNPDARWRTLPDQVERCAATQCELIERAAKAVRPGGRLIYSVCTLTRRETVDVVDAFISGHADYEFETIVHPLSRTPCRGIAWIWPWDGPCDGMFIAVMRRIPAH